MAKTTFSVIGLSCIILLSCNSESKREKEQTQKNTEESQLKDLVTKYPDSFALKEKLIDYYQVNENTNIAIGETKKLLEKDSSNDLLWYKQANLYSDKNDTVNTIYALQKAWSLKPRPQYLKELGYLYATKGDSTALDISDELFNSPMANMQEQAVFIKGVYYSSTGNKLKAIGAFDECLKMNYNDMLSYREKAICLFDLEKYNDALQVLQKAVMIKSDFDEAYYWMGRCYEKLGKKDEAINNYQNALQLDSSYDEAKDALNRLGVKQ